MLVTAQTTKSFLDSIGVNVHLSDTSSAYGNLPLVEQELKYLGVNQVRDNQPYDWSLGNYQTIAAAGIKLDLILGYNPNEQMNTADLQTDLSLIDQIAAAHPGSIIGVESLNEPYNFPNYWNGTPTNNWQVVSQVQQAEYNLVKADPTLQGVAFLGTSTDPNSFPGSTPPNMSATADLGNAHVYPYGGGQPDYVMNDILSGQQQIVPGKPDWITEFGYGTAPQDATYGVDEATAAKNTLNGLMDAFKAGVPKTFIYQLNDYISGSSSAWDKQGLFNPDGSTKLAATALHNLTSVLTDTGSNAASFTPGQIGYTITNLPATGNTLLMEKSSGVYDIALWNNVVDWNSNTQSPVTVRPVSTTISLDSTYATIKVYDPMAGASPIATYTNANTVAANLTDHPLVIELSGAAAPVPTPTPKPTPAPSANDTVVKAGSSGAIVDGSGNSWTITAGGQVAVNGTTDAITANVTELAYVNGEVWQENASNLWWGKASPSAAWSPNAGTSTSPLPAAPIPNPTPTPPPKPTPSPSANDTVVKAGSSGAIVDDSGNSWTITAGGQVAVNGTTDAITANVTELAYVNGEVWQENASNLWWGKTSPSAAWSPNAGTSTSPLPAAPIPNPTPTPPPKPTPSPSANDTVVKAGSSGAIVDGSGNSWTITAGGQVAVNGTTDAITANVTELAYVNGEVWQENASNLWWGKTSPAAAWSPSAGTSTSPLPKASGASPNDTMVLAGSSGAIVDGSGHRWTITGGGQVAVNGTTDATTARVTELAYVNGTVWQENASNLWWGKTSPSAAWSPDPGTGTSPLPAPIRIAPNATHATISQSEISAVATAGTNMVFVSGSNDIVRLAGGTNTVTDTGYGNTYILPAGGKGSVAFTSDILGGQDTLDLKVALAATGWNGSASTLARYLSVRDTASGATLSVAATAGGHGAVVASIAGTTHATLATVLAHSIV